MARGCECMIDIKTTIGLIVFGLVSASVLLGIGVAVGWEMRKSFTELEKMTRESYDRLIDRIDRHCGG